MMIDSHCHLAGDEFAGDLEAVVERARTAGVTAAMCILSADDRKESAAAARIRTLWPQVRFSLGVHPHHAGQFAEKVEGAVAAVRRGIKTEGAVAIGEIGLDYHYDFSPRFVQREVFEAQVALAREMDLAVVIHTREAVDDTFEVLRQTGKTNLRGVFHCFTGDSSMARRVLDLGFFISLSGIVTFPRATDLKAVAVMVPDDRLLIETDAPYLAPVPYRGKRNEPAFVSRIAEVIGGLRGVDTEVLASLMTRNFNALLGPTVSLQTA
jgi:TatD DNase family protein